MQHDDGEAVRARPADIRPPGIWTVVAIAAAAAAVSGGIVFRLLRQQLFDAMADRPPIAVVDVTRDTRGVDFKDTKAVNAALARVKRQLKALRADGYVVLDARSVLASPEGYYVPPGQE